LLSSFPTSSGCLPIIGPFKGSHSVDKVKRTAIKGFKLNPEEDHLNELGGCDCGGTGEEGKEEIFEVDLTLE